MKGLYHYQGMQLHYLSESEDYAVYKVGKAKTMSDRYNPYRVYKIGRRFGDSGWVMTHQLVEKYGDLFSGICCIRQMQGYT